MKKLFIALALVSCAAHAAELSVMDYVHLDFDYQNQTLKTLAVKFNKTHNQCIPDVVINSETSLWGITATDLAATGAGNYQISLEKDLQTRFVRVFGCNRNR